MSGLNQIDEYRAGFGVADNSSRRNLDLDVAPVPTVTLSPLPGATVLRAEYPLVP
jgi:hypothetical protein